MNKFIISFVVVVIVIIGWNGSITHAEETPEDEQLQEELNELFESEDLERQWQGLLNEYRDFMPLDQTDSWRDIISDGSIFSPSDWLSGITAFFLNEWVVNGKTLGMLIFLTLLSVFLKVLIHSFENQSVAKVSYLVIFGVLMTIAVASFHQAVTYTVDAIEAMSHFMLSLLPLFLSVMAAFGNIATVAFFNPFILFFTQVSGFFVSAIIVPLFFLSAILHIASEINEEYNVSQLANLLRQVAFILMGGFLTIFLTVMSLQGANTAVADGVAVRAAKFVTSNFIPVVGRMFTEATDTVLSASLLIKNGVGLAGIVVILIITLFPVLKVLVLGLIFRVSAALLQPVADGPIVNMIDWMGKHILYIMLALLMVSIMFFFALVMLVIIGNMSLMIR
ncbi:stage III sporulation protein AE [Alkalibacillus filiformis]|uniref:Stage III sporulation protein AE n=1 Tax=Alkalibacillus filiformis TaxID=200990 RepID=A0ABU0DRB2_9BACI|nr:stage III sporulation protein AE [Alkalibacillus filiformis]MDQ0350989.1 stage III sporulation protein AE [Alkalibacillus filiformis]